MKNIEVVDHLCAIMDRLRPRADGQSHACLKTFVGDRPGHDQRYAINTAKIQAELGWKPCVSFAQGIEQTVRWYLEHQSWCDDIAKGNYQRQRLGQSRELQST